MCKSKIQPLVPLVLRALQILMLLILTHRTPLLLSRFVAQSVVHPRKDEQKESKDIGTNQYAVSAMIEWLVVLAVDIGCNHAAHLYHHIVTGGGDGACTDAA
jgi:hypothetical protein